MAIVAPFIGTARHLAIMLLMLAVVYLVIGCSGGGSQESGANDPPTAGSTSLEPESVAALVATMTVMASVTDLDGLPIRGATVGDQGMTGSDGIVMAATQPSAAGWYRISAPGFVQEYLKPIGQFQNLAVFTTRLAPVDALQNWSLATAAPATFSVGDPAAPSLIFGLSAGAFSEDVVLSATLIDPLKTRTTLAPMDTADPLSIIIPFEIRAQNADGDDQPLATGETVQVTLKDDGGMGATPRLFGFNPDTGIWEEALDAGCSRVDSAHVQCTLSHFSHHGGAGGAAPPIPPSDDPQTAQRKSEQELKEWGESGDTSGGLPESLLDALTNELVAAIDWADAHPSEEAKTLLVNTIARMQLLGYDDYNHQDSQGVVRDTSDLFNAIERVNTALATPHIQDPQCINFEKIMHLAAQASIFGPESIAESLFEVFHELADQCNLIQGRVEYALVLANDIGWPSWGVYSARPRESGASYWTEYNDVHLVIRVSDEGGAGQEVVVDGKIDVQTDFPLVVYRREVNNEGYCSFDTFERFSYWGEPNKGKIEVAVDAKGDLAGLQYSDETLSAASFISMQQEYFDLGWAFEGTRTPVCVKADDARAVASLWENYQGQIMEQYKSSQFEESSEFLTWLNGKLPTVWDILDRAPDVTHEGGEDSFPTRIWRGSEILLDVVNLPSGEYGHKVIMRYDLQHIDYTKGGWIRFHQ